MVPAPVPVPAGLDVVRLITTLLQAQSEAQSAQANANHANLIAFHTATAQALGAKGGGQGLQAHSCKEENPPSMCGHFTCQRV
jgi:hypothetical protein